MIRTAKRVSLTVACIVSFLSCNLAWAESGEKSTADKSVTYSKEVVRILQNRCQNCHRPGQIGPFSLLDYEHAKDWAETIKEVVAERRMPPWFADPKFGKFANDRSLSKAEIETIASWVDAGCPKGEDRDLPKPLEFADGWFIGKPDYVASMPQEYHVPAKGTIDYQYFVIPTNWDEDRWVQAVELKPGNPAVVHHIVMFVRSADFKPGERGRDGNIREDDPLGFFAAVAPGYIPPGFPKGFGKKIPKGSNIILQMHYTANGTAQSDRSSVGLIFARDPVHTEVRTRGIFNTSFALPPGDGNYEVKSAFRFPQDSVVLSFMPHMHLRGKDFEYEFQHPDGRSEKLLSVKWNFNWQVHYELAQPLIAPKGSRINCVAHFDNSAANKANPDPDKRVTWGDQTWDEMMIGYINYYVPKSAGTATGAGGK